MMRTRELAVFLLSIFTWLIFKPAECRADDARPISFVEHAGSLEILIGGKKFATYVFRDEKTLRPYFANVHAPNGMQVTRNHPPKEGLDPVDHADLHPGIWLGFGDISKADFWRNKARVEHVEFAEPPKVADGKLTFTVRNRYVSGDKTVCNEVCRHSVTVQQNAVLLSYDSEFESDSPFAFGDQEEMGLGFRVASPLRVKGGNGKMVAADGKSNESQVRGSSPPWVDYSAEIDGERVGLALMQDPHNFRPSWFHARDYGLLVANPFGRNALTGGEKSVVTVKPGEKVRLRYGVLVHSSPTAKPVDVKGAYEEFVKSE